MLGWPLFSELQEFSLQPLFWKVFGQLAFREDTALIYDAPMGGGGGLLSLCHIQGRPMPLVTILILPEINPSNSEHQMDKEQSLRCVQAKKTKAKICFFWANHS